MANRACVHPQKGFMDTGWLHRDDAAWPWRWTESSSIRRSRRKGPKSCSSVETAARPLARVRICPRRQSTEEGREEGGAHGGGQQAKPRDPNKPVDVADDAEAMKAVTAAAQAEFVRLTVSTVRRRARVGRGGRVLVDRYGSHIVPKAVPPPDSKPSSHVRPASPRPTAQRQASFTGRVRYASSSARLGAAPVNDQRKLEGRQRAGWFSLTDDGYSSSSSDCDSVNEAPQIIPEAPPPPPPPGAREEKSQPCAACRGAPFRAYVWYIGGRRRRDSRGGKNCRGRRGVAAVDALAPADVGRTRGGTCRGRVRPARRAASALLGGRPDDVGARGARARRPATTCPQQRLAEMTGRGPLPRGPAGPPDTTRGRPSARGRLDPQPRLRSRRRVWPKVEGAAPARVHRFAATRLPRRRAHDRNKRRWRPS